MRVFFRKTPTKHPEGGYKLQNCSPSPPLGERAGEVVPFSRISRISRFNLLPRVCLRQVCIGEAAVRAVAKGHRLGMFAGAPSHGFGLGDLDLFWLEPCSFM